MLQGTGKKKFERMLMSAEEKFPGKVRAVVKFNAALAHHIMAGADVLAVTSRFEPCGLIQLQGMRYGTVRERKKNILNPDERDRDRL